MRIVRTFAFLILSLAAIAFTFYACDKQSADDTVVAVPVPTPVPTPTPSGPVQTPTPVATPLVRVVSSDFAFTANDRLSTVGLGAMSFGETLEEAAEKAEVAWVGVPEGPLPDCFVVTPAGGPPELRFTVIDGKIRRIDVGNDLISTRSGARVGTPEDVILTQFGGNLDVQRTETGKRIAFVPNDVEEQDYRIIWVTDDVQAVSMRAGELPYVEPEQPC